MKNTYIQPTCNMIRIKVQRIMEGSVTPLMLGNCGDNVIGDYTDASRLNINIWGDDDEDDE